MTKKDAALAWYYRKRAVEIFTKIRLATLFTQNEVYMLCQEFIEWFEANDGPGRWKDKYGDEFKIEEKDE